MKKLIRIFDVFCAMFTAVIFSFVIYGNIVLPDEMIVRSKSDEVIGRIYSLSDSYDESVDYQSAKSVGETSDEIKLLGIIPVKDETVTRAQKQTVFVSGQSFGIKLYTDGVIVVGTKDISVNGKTVNPSKEAGIEIGDIIISINNKKVYSSDEVESILNDNNGEDYSITIKRNGNYKTLTLSPVYLPDENCFKAGMWVRDSTAGIGTVTFFNPHSHTVATLGHPITDVDTGEIMPILNGEAVETKVTSVVKSTSNDTGSLCCDFLSTSIGSLTKNTNYGVYGMYDNTRDMSNYCKYEVASPQEIERGFAQIICTVDENGPQVYSVEITKVSYNDEEKNMIIKITDDRLKSITGGIVQGMSGTPIIQNGKLVGAITHVIVNNPQKGYAIFAQTMVNETE